MGVKVYYWSHTKQNWGHASLGLSNGTHISWWPKRAINQHKKVPGGAGVAIAAITEWVDPFPDQTFDKDKEYEGAVPSDVVEFPAGALDESAIQKWWESFKTKNKYNGLRLNCATIVWMALKAGGALKYVKDPKHWWWEPDSILKTAKAIKKGISEHQVVNVGLPAIPSNIQSQMAAADQGGSIHEGL